MQPYVVQTICTYAANTTSITFTHNKIRCFIRITYYCFKFTSHVIVLYVWVSGHIIIIVTTKYPRWYINVFNSLIARVLTTQWFLVVARPDVRRKVFEEHWAIGTVVAPIVHFAAAKNCPGRTKQNNMSAFVVWQTDLLCLY